MAHALSQICLSRAGQVRSSRSHHCRSAFLGPVNAPFRLCNTDNKIRFALIHTITCRSPFPMAIPFNMVKDPKTTTELRPNSTVVKQRPLRIRKHNKQNPRKLDEAGSTKIARATIRVPIYLATKCDKDQKWTHPARELKPCHSMRGALDWSVEHSNRKPLRQHTNLKVDVRCGWNIYVDSRHRQPNKKLFCFDSFQVADGAKLQCSCDLIAVISQLNVSNRWIIWVFVPRWPVSVSVQLYTQ